MAIGRTTLLFFDASCLIAAAGSPSGGSGFLLSLCAMGFLSAVVSQLVLIEAERHVFRDLGPAALEHYDQILAQTPMRVMPVPTEDELAPHRGLVSQEDEHVIASAIASGAGFLVTLDKRLARQVTETQFAIAALAPGDFITGLLPQHAEYPAMRNPREA